MSSKTSKKLLSRQRRKARVRRNITGSSARPRLSVFRSSKHIYAQVIDDSRQHTLATASTLDDEIIQAGGTKVDEARLVGMLLARRCTEASVTEVVFDRNGYPYNSGRVKALAEGAREGGLKF
jgi:large subunit ribosomal protein L18